MFVADIRMIDIVPLRDASQKGSWILRQRVKVELIDDEADEGGDRERKQAEEENRACTGPNNASNVRACHFEKHLKCSCSKFKVQRKVVFGLEISTTREK